MNLNRVILVGYLGRDPEIKWLPSGTAVTTASLATTEEWGNEKKEKRTEWHSLVAYGKVAEIMVEFFKKGSLAYVEGKIHYRLWNKDDVKKIFTEIIVSTIKNLSSRVEKRELGDKMV